MRIDIVTLFPEMCENLLAESIIGRARSRGHLQVCCHQLRQYGEGVHKRVDDCTFGGGKGMLIIPGGYLEKGETPQDALKREFLEETGVTVKPGNLVGVNFSAENWYAVFAAEYVSGEARSDQNENSEVVWMDTAEAMGCDDVPDLTKKLIECTLRGEGLVPVSYESRSKNGVVSLYGVNI